MSFLDDRLDTVAAVARKTFWARVIIASLCLPLLVLNLGLPTTACWAAAFAAGEVWTWVACRPAAASRPATRAERLSYLGSNFMTGLAWTALAALYWSTGEEALRLVAMVIPAAVLILSLIHI